jgi:hypothetical protein
MKTLLLQMTFWVVIGTAATVGAHSSNSQSHRFWIGDEGPSGPRFTGTQQYPFICFTSESGLGQPIVDNQDGIGNAVYATEGDPTSGIVGYSANCSLSTRVDYFYFGRDGRFRMWDPQSPAADVVQIEFGGEMVNFIVRVETGTINRFMYDIAMLAPYPERLDSPKTLNNSAWNEDLIYFFGGGAGGIGHWQGEDLWHTGLSSLERVIFAQLLSSGYAIATSTGNDTSVHYNLRLAEETALMVKKHFKKTYGKPRYTIGLGGSGGAIQQYVISQNRPHLLDAGMPLLSYPDMITQTIHILDCNLLEQYFLEETSVPAPTPWRTWSNRRWVQGLNASDVVINSLTRQPGSSECIEGWLFAEPAHLNPFAADEDYFAALKFYNYPEEVISSIRWTHWNDLENIYGVDENGFAPIPFDNVGVQYGLEALVDGNIDKGEFLKLNSCVGAWIEQKDFQPYTPAVDLFDAQNTTKGEDAISCRLRIPSPRRSGDLSAMQNAYRSGHVFRGKLRIPMIDLRPYLEPALDMHNSRQSFSVRERILRRQGHHDNHAIWFVENEVDLVAKIKPGLDTLTEYLDRGEAPAQFTDACFNGDGEPIGIGGNVWDGILNSNPPGVCTDTYPVFASSRMVAGDSYAGDMFKCQLKSVDQAMIDGTYGNVSFGPAEEAWLRDIFPTGVCDYSKRDAGRPKSRAWKYH